MIRFLSVCIYAFFLFSGYFKSDPRLSWIPVDLTLLMGIATICAVFLVIIQRPRLPKSIFFVMPFFLLLIPGLFFSEWSAYSIEKTFRMFTQTLLVAMAPAFLIRTERELLLFFQVIVGLGTLITINVFPVLLTSHGEIWRVSAFGSSVIAIGRTVGPGLIILVTMLIGRQRFSLFHVVLTCAFATVILASGQRAPLVGVLSGLLAAGFTVTPRCRLFRLRITGLAVCLVVCLALSWSLQPQRTKARFSLGSAKDIMALNTRSRLLSITNSFVEAVHYPFGVGLGGFQTHIDPSVGTTLVYPHNIIAEAALEGGWIACAYLTLIIAYALRLSFLMAKNANYIPQYRTLLAILVFAVLYSMVAGDFNGNRMVFGLLTIVYTHARSHCRKCDRYVLEQPGDQDDG